MAATAFAFHILPDDIIHTVVGEWLFDKDSCWDNLRLLSVIDKAYCNHSLRPIVLSAMAGFEVSVEEWNIQYSYRGDAPFDRQSLFKWIEARKFKVGTVGLYEQEKSTSRALTQQQRLLPMRDVHTILINVKALNDLSSPAIITAIRDAHELKNIHLLVDSWHEPSSGISESALDVLCRVTQLTTWSPNILGLMKSLAPTLREVSLNDRGGFQHLDLSVWQSETFSQMETLNIVDSRFDELEEEEGDYDEAEEEERINDNPSGHGGHLEHQDYAHLPKLTSLTLLIEGDSASRIILHQFIRGAPLLIHLEIRNFTTWTKDLSMDLLMHPPPHLRSFVVFCEMFDFKATSKTRFLPLPEDAYIALPASDGDEDEDDGPMNEFYLNAVLFVAQEPSLVIDLWMQDRSSDLLNRLPWQVLAQRKVQSLKVEINDFRLTKETWVNMILAPTSNLDVTFHINHESKVTAAEMKVCMEALNEIQESGRTSTITKLVWETEIATGFNSIKESVEKAWTKASIAALLSAFPNVVHCRCRTKFVSDQDFIAFLERWSNLRMLRLQSSSKLKLAPSTLQTWKQQLLPKTQCHTYHFFHCSDLTLHNFLKFVLELRAASTRVPNWFVEYSISPYYPNPLYSARPMNEDAEGRNVIVTKNRIEWKRFYPVYKGKQLVLKPFSPDSYDEC